MGDLRAVLVAAPLAGRREGKDHQGRHDRRGHSNLDDGETLALRVLSHPLPGPLHEGPARERALRRPSAGRIQVTVLPDTFLSPVARIPVWEPSARARAISQNKSHQPQ